MTSLILWSWLARFDALEERMFRRTDPWERARVAAREPEARAREGEQVVVMIIITTTHSARAFTRTRSH
jgi:hypothetical protein